MTEREPVGILGWVKPADTEPLPNSVSGGLL